MMSKQKIFLVAVATVLALVMASLPSEEIEAAPECTRTHYSNGDIYMVCESGLTCWWWEEGGEVQNSCYYV